MQELGQDINRETPAYKTYKNWLVLKEFLEEEYEELEGKAEDLLTQLEEKGDVDKSWVQQIMKLIFIEKKE